jgi:hypothetical protein
MTSRWMLYTEMIVIYYDKHTENVHCVDKMQCFSQAGSTYKNH